MRQILTSVVSRPCQLVVVLILLVLPFFLNCAPIRVNTETLAPAKSREMTGIRRIAVLDFNGEGGLELSREVESTLVGIRVKGDRHFTVVDRESLANVLHEMGLAERKIVTSKTAAKIGQLIGAEAIVLGTVQDAVVNDDFYMAEREVCSDKKCRYRTTRLVLCTKREVHYAFTPKVVRVSSGRIITSESLRERLVRHSCSGGRALESRTTLVTEARKQAIEGFVQLIAPHVVKTDLPILLGDSTKPKAGITGTLLSGFQRAKAPFSGAAKWAKEGRLDRACPAWEEAYKQHPESYALPYNLGVCAEASGQLEEAQRLYETADRNTNQPVGEISQALERIRKRQAQRQELAHQLAAKGATRGGKNGAIVEVQKRLAERGYDPGHPDGRLGSQTRRALKAFQSDHQLPSTGRLDAATKTALGF